MNRYDIEVVENATNASNILPETPLEKVVADCMTDYLEMRNAEEQGLLLRLQFKIGQKVYYIYKSCIDKSLMIGSMIYSYSCLDFPREYFATKEEAEQALKQMGE